ncbi:MAG: electron transfer flavoprotein subunit alpha/FixB family protein [Comamonadaceae bacterium]|nr:MAG: electron transfer flavoprotein subunit alpha/FixB family protein [Comamonadaceae bacterium]
MSIRIVVALHPWLTPDEAAALVAAAARLAPDAAVEVFRYATAAGPDAIAAHLARQCGDPNAVTTLLLAPQGAEGEQIAAATAAATGGHALGRCSSLAVQDHAIVATRAVFGGRAELALRSDARLACAVLRPEAIAAGTATAAVRTHDVTLDDAPPFTAEAVPATQAHPRVDGAAMVVAGGRGMAGEDGFALLARIAGALGAGLGGSLPAVDAGWVPVAHQVGQSGKFVSPKVYFAVGISGTPQHLAGIAGAARIIALNNDRDAPIFGRCDVGVEGDWREILPLLAAQLEAGH